MLYLIWIVDQIKIGHWKLCCGKLFKLDIFNFFSRRYLEWSLIFKCFFRRFIFRMFPYSSISENISKIKKEGEIGVQMNFFIFQHDELFDYFLIHMFRFSDDFFVVYFVKWPVPKKVKIVCTNGDSFDCGVFLPVWVRGGVFSSECCCQPMCVSGGNLNFGGKKWAASDSCERRRLIGWPGHGDSELITSVTRCHFLLALQWGEGGFVRFLSFFFFRIFSCFCWHS